NTLLAVVLRTQDEKDNPARKVDLRVPTTGTSRHVLATTGGEITRIAFDRRGATLASGHRDGEIQIWDVATGRLQSRLTAHDKHITALEFDEEGRLAIASHDGTVRVWDPAREKVLRLEIRKDMRCRLHFQPGGSLLVAELQGFVDHHLLAWD